MIMNLEQILRKIASDCDYLNDKTCTRVYVVALSGHPALSAVLERIKLEIIKVGLKAKVIVAGSNGLYDLEPFFIIEKPGKPVVYYPDIGPESAAELVNDYLVRDNPRPELALDRREPPLFALQNRIALRNCGRIDPENIGEYVLRSQGYRGLSRALQMTRAVAIEELRSSGLRGRGGGGYLTAEKWRICRDAAWSEKYVICNAADADPQARTARLLLESDPHSVLEGMLITGYAVGATHGIIGVKSEYAAALKRLTKALTQMRGYGLLGNNILDADFNFDIEIKEIAPSLVSGEETALIRSLEGKQAMPYVRTTYPAVKGFKDLPTLVGSVETFSNVSAIFQNGLERYSGIGTERSRGTKVITLSGNVTHQYTVEVPMGTTLRRLIDDIGGGVLQGKGIKAVQFGGPTGRFFASDSLDIPVNYESLNEAGGTMGSGTIEVFDTGSCAVETARDVLTYLQSQSCGKCVFCREGTYQMLDILTDISANRGKPGDIDMLLKLGEAMKSGSICALGRTAPDPVLSTLSLFRMDYEAHIREKRCPLKEKNIRVVK
ncbi:MAG: hypothetical protein A2Z29_01620 [Chloroflexi bacterium RBG_16_56_11]|nr:MAG: hypothetical protein A2Z29_01620 [Chloroflexi bacterium RBG_16_56_11]